MIHIFPFLLLSLVSCCGAVSTSPRNIYSTKDVAHGLNTLTASARITQPVLIPIQYHGEEQYQNIEEWSFTEGGIKHIVPKGLVVDGASVPRACWWFMPPDGLHRAAAFAHDWLYILKGLPPEGQRMTRHECDIAFYDLMVDAGVSTKRAGTAYRGVRLGGWVVWNRPAKPPLILPVERRAVAPIVTKPRTPFSHIYEP